MQFDQAWSESGGTVDAAARGVPPGGICHGGFYHSAVAILRHLDVHGTLAQVMHENPDATLVVTGHSLGAAAACLITMVMRGRYPGTRGMLYAPPSAVDIESAKYPSVQKYITSIILGHDMVPRMSRWSLDQLIGRSVMLAARCRTPKWLILTKSLFGKGLARKDIFGGPDDMTEEARVTLENLLQQQAKRIYPEMAPSGRLLWIEDLPPDFRETVEDAGKELVVYRHDQHLPSKERQDSEKNVMSRYLVPPEDWGLGRASVSSMESANSMTGTVALEKEETMMVKSVGSKSMEDTEGKASSGTMNAARKVTVQEKHLKYRVSLVSHEGFLETGIKMKKLRNVTDHDCISYARALLTTSTQGYVWG